MFLLDIVNHEVINQELLILNNLFKNFIHKLILIYKYNR